jgi:hypothetical protein
MKLMNRNAVIITHGDDSKITVLGPFKKYGTACNRRDEIVEYLEDHHDMVDGTDYTIDTVSCMPVASTFQDIEGDMDLNEF